MSMVKKLSVQGVRSFSPLDSKGQWIEFDSPLTIILGVNGSGKTTIIEALKYAITNQFPPNSSKGSSFVNDPKLGNSFEAVAKVMLEVVDSKGDKYVTSRRIKCSVRNKQGDLTMKQMDASITFKPIKGEQKVLLNKCIDTKFEMCRIMGVSEAILNHVIFCHQEESCWPLDEGKKVKERFDAIFNTNAYMKCIDQFGKEDKELNTKIKVEAEGLRFCKENRQLAIRKRRELDDKKIKMQEQNARIEEYKRELSLMETKLLEFQALEKEYSKKAAEVTEKRTRIDAVTKQINELRNNITEEFCGSASDLKEGISKFKLECTEKANKFKNQERELKTKESEWQKLDATKNSLAKEEGAFKQEENSNKKRLEELNVLMGSVITCMKKLKTGSDSSMSTSFSSYLDACDSESGLSYDAVVKTITSAVRMKESELQKLKEDFEKEEVELQDVIDDVRSKLAGTQKEQEMKRQQLIQSKKTYEDIKKRLQNLEGSDETLAFLDDDQQKYIEQIESIEKSGFMVQCDSAIKALAAEIKQLETNMSTVSDLINVLIRDKSKTDQISMLNRNKLQKQNECNDIMRRIEDDLSALLGTIPVEGLGKTVDSKAKTISTELKERKGDLKKKEVASAVTKSELKQVMSELHKMGKKLSDGKVRITDVLEDEEYDAVYLDLNTTLEKTQSDCAYAESASFLYKKYLRQLTKKDCCPLCKRDFEAKALTDKLAKEVEQDITRMQQDVPRYKEEIEEMKNRQQRVLKVKPLYDECHRLESDVIPSLKTRKEHLETEELSFKEEIDELNSTITVLETDLKLATDSLKDVTLYEQSKKEIKKLEDQISKIETSRESEAQSCSTSLSDAQTEFQELKGAISNKRSDKENKEDIRNKKRDELAKLQEQKNKVKEEILRITSELQNREALETQKKELESTTKEVQAKINELAQSVPSLKTDITKAEKSKVACVQKKEEALKRLRAEKETLEKQKYSITELHKHVEEFEKRKGRFADIQQRVTACKENLTVNEQERRDIRTQMDSLKKDIVGQELKQRDLQDNLLLKEKVEEVASLQVDLKEKETILIQAENRGAAAEKREVQEKYHKITKKYHELNGSKDEAFKSIRDLEKDLKGLANAESDYIQKVAKKTVYEKAQKDVRRYRTCLEQAIMQFHLKKMEKINKILFEYWRRIYKGNDIDKIMIKTEADKDPGESKVKVTAKTRKTYNYRVVMVRRGVEIDMRGRCSAGQRVLASIIIRIALAESFGARCGIISLDEPTTNLDQKNINSLADALADLADKMSSRKNFQLIVITHDQEFTQRLTAVDAVEKFWKVDRDREGFSQIIMVPKRGYGGYL